MDPETKHSLNDAEVRVVLARARYDKIKHYQWVNKGNPLARDVDDIDLTDEETELALDKAAKIKDARLYYDKLRRENIERRQAEEDRIKKLWDASYFYRIMRDEAFLRGEELIYNDQTAPVIKTICYKLSSDPRYQSEFGFSYAKGLMIRGNPGLGKSWIPSLVADNPICSLQIVTLNEITETVRKTGEYTGLKFATYSIIYLDDLGTEETPVKYFGTEMNWFKTWYENFYSTAKAKSNRLIISTNLSFQDIEGKYGFRIRDRLAETFDVLDLSGTSLRRK